jgi:hypothetical protein
MPCDKTGQRETNIKREIFLMFMKNLNYYGCIRLKIIKLTSFV